MRKYYFPLALVLFQLSSSCCKLVHTDSRLNLHFPGLSEGDSIMLKYQGYYQKDDSAFFEYNPQNPLTIRFQGPEVNSLNATSNYIIVSVPSKNMSDTLTNISFAFKEARCGQRTPALLQLEKDGVSYGPAEQLEIVID